MVFVTEFLCWFAADEDKALVPNELTGEFLAQTWYRLLHSIGNPVQLAKPGIVSHTHKFLQYALINSQVTADRPMFRLPT